MICVSTSSVTVSIHLQLVASPKLCRTRILVLSYNCDGDWTGALSD